MLPACWRFPDLGAMSDLSPKKRGKADVGEAAFTHLDSWIYGSGRADGGEELAYLGLEALVFAGKQLRIGEHL
jgi:hypothetical protein